IAMANGVDDRFFQSQPDTEHIMGMPSIAMQAGDDFVNDVSAGGPIAREDAFRRPGPAIVCHRISAATAWSRFCPQLARRQKLASASASSSLISNSLFSLVMAKTS